MQLKQIHQGYKNKEQMIIKLMVEKYGLNFDMEDEESVSLDSDYLFAALDDLLK
jgi:hypothetical protein